MELQKNLAREENVSAITEYLTGSQTLRSYGLAGMSFDIPENKITAIVGDSGSGKSTIFNLITKYYEPENGSIRIGGKELVNANAEQVLSNISLVDQDVFLFNDTIKNNLLFAAPEASDEEILDACRKANCSFIEQLPDGINRVVGENGKYASMWEVSLQVK